VSSLQSERKENSVDSATQSNQEQATHWNGDAGRAWVEVQALLDTVLEPFVGLLLDAVRESAATRVLDVGCGTGATIRTIARLLGPQGCCIGIDISAPMIAAARGLAGTGNPAVRFIHADAQTHAFVPASFDMIVSRFGVMFFDDNVQAFGNLRGALRDGGMLRFVAWRSAAENPFMTAAERAVAPLLPELPPRVPDAPGQFALADRARIAAILEASGWVWPEVRPIDIECSFPAADLTLFMSRLGPLGRVLPGVDESRRQALMPIVRAALQPFVHGEQVRFTAACWMVSARCPAR
jgi:SAM-dependent methyltransferase